MGDCNWLAAQFEANRTRLRAVAHRMLGSPAEADDAVQETWLRLNRAGGQGIQNLGGWLTTVVARVCLDILRSRKSRREEPLPDEAPVEPAGEDASDPEREALLADSIGPALVVVLEALTPAERVAFVLHDMFGVPFDEVARIVERSPEAARQLASRARRRVRGAAPAGSAHRRREREIVEAFLAASRTGNFEALLALLDPQVVLRGDAAVVRIGGAAEVRGAHGVAETFRGRAQGARLALIDGVAGALWAPGGKPRVAFRYEVRDGRIVRIEMIGDPALLSKTDLVVLEE